VLAHRATREACPPTELKYTTRSRAGQILEQVSVFLNFILGIYVAYTTYRLGREKNRNDAHRMEIDELTARQAAAEAEQAKLRKEAEERTTKRKEEQQGLESFMEQMRKERESEQSFQAIQRETIAQMFKDMGQLRTDNFELTKQVQFLTLQDDRRQRDYETSESERKSKAAALEEAQRQITGITTQLSEANHTVSLMRREMELQQGAHDREIDLLTQLHNGQRDELQRQVNEIKDNYKRQLDALQLSEGPRNLELTHLRFTLREAHKRLNPAQIEELTTLLMDRGTSYDSLLFPRLDPLLFPMTHREGEDNPPTLESGPVEKSA